jgi:multicomponent Na+:H+ antiporter subunit A
MPDASIAVLAAPFLLACIAAAISSGSARHPSIVGGLLAIPMALAAGVAGHAWLTGQVPQFEKAWVPALGVDFALRADALSWMLVTLVLGIGAAVVAYGGSYLGPGRKTSAFFPLVLLFAGAMCGIALADDLVLLFLFWELTSIASFLLIGMNHEQAVNRKKATQALLVTGLGGLGLLTAAILCGLEAGTTRISVLLAEPALILDSPRAGWIAGLLLLAIFTKSAQFPFHFWLPNAMAGPTPVSAYLHSATMVKAGIFLAAKFSPVFHTLPGWRMALLAAGLMTLGVAALRGLRGSDLKSVLAASTLAVLGMLTALVGTGTATAGAAFVLLFVSHALYKAPLFMTAGAIEHATGTKDLSKLGGLGASQPLLFAIAVVSLLSFAGLPPAAGFLGKEYFLKALAELHPATLALILPALAVVLALGLRVAWLPFRGAVRHRDLHPSGPGLLLPPAVIALGGLIVPMLLTRGSLVEATAASLGLPGKLPVIAFWTGWNVAIFASVVVMVAGVALFLKAALPSEPDRVSVSDRIYHAVLDGTMSFAKSLTRFVQDRPPAAHITLVLATLFLILAIRLFDAGFKLPAFRPTPDLLPVLVIGGLVAAAALVAALASRPATVIVTLGMVGLGVSIFFVWFSAPDLALTQILVETLVVMLLVFALPWLGDGLKDAPKPPAGTALFATAAGALAMLLVLKASLLPSIGDPVSRYHLEHSVPAAKGGNVVNVILVDFRALDTWGEITVLGLAALGVIELLRSRRGHLPDATASLLEPLRRLLAPVLVTLAVILLWRGHNQPGGGFIGALILSLTGGLAILGGKRAALDKQRGPRLVVLGLALAGIASMIAPLLGRPWFTGLWLPSFELPLIGKVLLGTPLLFDIGVLFAVMGFASICLRSFSGIHEPRTTHI